MTKEKGMVFPAFRPSAHDFRGGGFLPKQIANEMVFVNVVAEVVDFLPIGQGFEVWAAEHVWFPDEAGCD
jgi:hypothetical protein